MTKEKEKIEKVERAIEELFTAQLEMTTIHPKVVRYRVTHHNGLGVIGLHHIEIDRRNFPKDDDFNMDFINKELSKDVPKGLVKKQADFKVFKELALTISTV